MKVHRLRFGEPWPILTACSARGQLRQRFDAGGLDECFAGKTPTGMTQEEWAAKAVTMRQRGGHCTCQPSHA